MEIEDEEGNAVRDSDVQNSRVLPDAVGMHRMSEKIVVVFLDEEGKFWLKSPNGDFPAMDVTEDFSASEFAVAMKDGSAPNPLIIAAKD